MKGTVYIVILHDRHTDPEISVHRTLEGANARFAEHQAAYASDGYTWSEEPIRGWVRNARTQIDDGPSMHIEEHEVEE